MLEHTFIHIQGIGPKTETTLWRQGVLTWEDFLGRKGGVFSVARDRFIREELENSIRHRNDIRFFRDRLPEAEHWRLYDAFRGSAVFLDIETSGGYGGIDEITVIGLYDGAQFRAFLNGDNLMEFETAIAGFDLVVTFNGTGFDIPFIRRSFPHISLPAVHIDLRFVLKKLGLGGGLKKIERQLGIGRETDVEGLDGFDAVRLWRAFQWGDPGALALLLRYNRADVVHLRPLMEMASTERKNRLLNGPFVGHPPVQC